MTEQEASNLLSQSGLNHGMVDAEYQPARWMFEAVLTAVAAEREASAKAARDLLTKGRSPHGDTVYRAIMERSNSTISVPCKVEQLKE